MIVVVTDANQLIQFKHSWDALAELKANPLMSFDWFFSCIETIHASDKLRVVLVEENGRIVAIAPLCLTSVNGLKTLELIGVSTLHEPSGFLYEDSSSLVELLQAVVGLGLPVMLLRIPDDPVFNSSLALAGGKNSFILRRETAPAAFLNLPSEWSHFLGSMSSRRRYDFRRGAKRLGQAGEVSTRIICPSPDELPALLRVALSIEDQSWKGQNGSSLTKDSELRRFFEAYLHKACAQEILRICLTYVNEQPISMQIAIQVHRGFWLLKVGYDESVAKSSPGIQLTMNTIKHSIEQGLARYEFLGSEEPWLRAWPIERHHLLTVLIYPYSFHGFWALFRFSLSYVKKRMFRFFGR